MSASVRTDLLILGATGFTGKLVARYLSTHNGHSSPGKGGGTGGIRRKSMVEDVEAEKIRQLEERMRLFEDGGGGGHDSAAQPLIAGDDSGHQHFTFALGGRSETKLRAVANELKLQVPIVVVDVQDRAQVEAAVKSTRVIINLAGPYWLYAKLVVEACANHGVHYVDLSGEPHFMLWAIENFDEAAKRTGATIVPACGHDCIPAESSVFLANRTLKKTTKNPNASIDHSITAFKLKGGISGGTFASMVSAIEEVPKDLRNRARAAFALSPAKGPKYPSPKLCYTVPYSSPSMHGGIYMMAAVDVAVVQRTWGIFKQQRALAQSGSTEAAFSEDEAAQLHFGDEFKYEETMVMPNSFSAYALSGVLVLAVVLFIIPPTRWVLKKIVPQSGEGPSEDLLKNGFIHTTNITTSTPDAKGTRTYVRTTMKAKGDPGYFLTSIMIAEAGIALATEHNKLPALGRRGGVLTTMTALGDVLLDRMTGTGHWIFQSEIFQPDGKKSQ